MIAHIKNWMTASLESKFVLLLAGFLAVQGLLMVVGVHGVLHLGEEGTFINEAGRQRFRTLLAATLAEEALAGGKKSGVELSRLRAEMDAHYDRFREFFDAERGVDKLLFHDADHKTLRAMVTQAEEIWRRDLRPLLVAVGEMKRPAAHTAIARYKAAAPAQVARLDKIVELLEDDLRKNAVGLASIGAALLLASLALGMIGIGMARLIVTRPLRRLIEGAQAIAAGAYDRRMTVSSRDEVGALAGAFNRMAAAIEENTRRLTAYNEVAATVTSSLSLSEVLERIMRYGTDVSGVRAASVVFRNPEDGFKEWVTHGLSDRFVQNMNFRPGGLADEVFATGNVILSNDRPETRYRLSALAREEGIRSFLCLPLTSQSNRLGVINFYRSDRDTFAEDEIAQLSTFASLAAGAIENARLHARAIAQAVTDALTGLGNRRQFDARFTGEVERARRYGKIFSLLLLDIDHFKRVNDLHGHDAGDVVLKALAGILLEQVREVDFVARYGGEEFAVILPETDGPGAKLVAERIRRAIASAPFPLPAGSEIGVTASIGLAAYPECGDTVEDLLRHADQALYVAKEGGRNRVVLYRETLKAELERDPNRIVVLLRDNPANIEPVLTAIAAKAGFYHHHVHEVERIALWLARVLDLPTADREALRLASRLHDIGMVTIPDAVLSRREALSPEEWDIIRRHPATGADLLEQVPAFRHVAAIVRHHHERFDGGGYPDGLRGEATPFLARVLALADAYVSVIADWPGHRAETRASAVAALNAGAGTQFDPALVKAFVQALGKAPPDPSPERSSATA